MAMSIHAARENQLACGIDGSACLEPTAECGDLVSFNRHIHPGDAFGGGDASAFDDEIVFDQWIPKFQGASFIRFDARNLCR